MMILGSYHHHQALRIATDTDILEQPVDVRNIVEDGHTSLGAAFPQAFDAAHQYRSPVRNGHRGRNHGEAENG